MGEIFLPKTTHGHSRVSRHLSRENVKPNVNVYKHIYMMYYVNMFVHIYIVHHVNVYKASYVLVRSICVTSCKLTCQLENFDFSETIFRKVRRYVWICLMLNVDFQKLYVHLQTLKCGFFAEAVRFYV